MLLLRLVGACRNTHIRNTYLRNTYMRGESREEREWDLVLLLGRLVGACRPSDPMVGALGP